MNEKRKARGSRSSWNLRLMNGLLEKLVVPSLAILCAAGLADGRPGVALAGWHLVWSDEFRQPDGSAPDPQKWGYDTGGSGWGNDELENYTSRVENAHIEGGKLVIEARKEEFGNSHYTSARLLTMN